ncbi:unnamed protein product [Rotaria socialis]|uniref:MAP3K TRAFs-binding domain-containing protein n=2 Tax=Rotaria socialis TaxID=392032 RepID=A0A821CK56_9BILA|nr:unnamed protein product [Rotaria socialis]
MPSSANKIDKPNAAIVLSSNQPVQVYYYDCGFGRLLHDLTYYWDVATYFELHAAQCDSSKACLAACYVTPRMHDQQKLREQPPTSSYDQDVYSFWIDYFSDTINSNSNSTQTEE